ncbi:MAG: alpha-galactosidase, partial [Eubacterium sp.]|nr:alpha-galactosidase [Eubacterium sp.]
MAIERVSSFDFGDMTIVFERETEFNRIGFYMVPKAMKNETVCEKKFYRINSLAQLKLTGDMYPNCYGHGATMRNGDSANRMQYDSQRLEETSFGKEIHTLMKDDRGYTLENIITYYNGEDSFEMKNVFTNESEEMVTMEMLSSFEMGNVSPFLEGIGTDALLVHRLRSKWSHEGRLVTETVEDLQLEPSWSNWAVGVERFGQRGSMPVCKFFPFVAVEDSKNKVLWGAQLAHEASWQMEVYRQDDGLHVSGGLADREFGHWMKNIQPGECFETPKAILTVCKGDVDLLCHRLVSAGEKYLEEAPASEQDMPII